MKAAGEPVEIAPEAEVKAAKAPTKKKAAAKKPTAKKSAPKKKK